MQIERALGVLILASCAYYVKWFDRAGKKLPVFSRFGGTRFHFERQPIPNLAGDFCARFSAYAAYSHVGMLKPEWGQA